jgi:hypothetical protein
MPFNLGFLQSLLRSSFGAPNAASNGTYCMKQMRLHSKWMSAASGLCHCHRRPRWQARDRGAACVPQVHRLRAHAGSSTHTGLALANGRAIQLLRESGAALAAGAAAEGHLQASSRRDAAHDASRVRGWRAMVQGHVSAVCSCLAANPNSPLTWVPEILQQTHAHLIAPAVYTQLFCLSTTQANKSHFELHLHLKS